MAFSSIKFSQGIQGSNESVGSPDRSSSRWSIQGYGWSMAGSREPAEVQSVAK